MRRLGWMMVVALVLVAGQASAQNVSIKAFFGVWQGSALSESNISTHFRVSARDLDVEIRPFGAGGFTVHWATVLRQKGDPSAPAEVLKEAQVAFIVDESRRNVWQAATQGDPIQGKGCYWARLEGQTLSVYALGVGQDGTAELQIYRRTLTGSGMELEFTRNVDGEAIRTAKGRLIKFAD